MPLVSVIIPTYNRPVELRRALNSILAQTLTDFEVLVINDGEYKNTVLEIIHSFNDKRIIYSDNQRQKGGNGARNTGIIKSNGKYIAFLDDDDEWLKRKLEFQIKKISKLNQSWGGAYCGYSLLIDDTWINKNNLPEGNFQYKYLVRKTSIGASSTLIFRKSVFDQIGLWDEDLRRNQDNELLLRFFEKYNLACVNQVLIKIHGHNIPKGMCIENEKDLYIKKITPVLAKYSPEELNLFWAYHFRAIAFEYSLIGNNRKSIRFLIHSLRYRIISPTSYVSVFKNIFMNIFKQIKKS